MRETLNGRTVIRAYALGLHVENESRGVYGGRGRVMSESVKSGGAGEGKGSDEVNGNFQDVLRVRVRRLKTKDRIANVDSRWSIEVRYKPRDSVVDVGAQMKRGKNRNQVPEDTTSPNLQRPRGGERRRKDTKPNSHNLTLAHERVLGERLLVIVLPRG